MITEIKQGNIFTRGLFGNFFGFRELFYKPYLPEFLNHPLPQGEGVTMWLKGPNQSFEVICETPTGSVSLSALAPPGTVFRVDPSPFANFVTNTKEKRISIPSNLKYLKKYGHPYTVLHEDGHLWSQGDEEWSLRLKTARETIGDTVFFSRAVDGKVWLSDDQKTRQEELLAWRIYGEEERRAAATALYFHGRLLNENIDILPRLKNDKKIQELVNGLLKRHEVFHVPLTFTAGEIRNFLNGELPYKEVQTVVSNHFEELKNRAIQYKILATGQ